MIPAEAVEAAAKAIFGDPYGETWALQVPATQERCREDARLALEAAAPYMLAEVERELLDAQRVIALLVTNAGGKVTLSRKSITDLPADTVIETTQDVINGGWVIRAGSRQHGNH